MADDLTFVALDDEELDDEDRQPIRRRGQRPEAPAEVPDEVPDEVSNATAPHRAVRRVRVLAPFQVVHDGTAYWPDATAEVPESIAAKWILNRWVSDDSQEGRQA